jgi:hypothetical protein
MRGVISSLKKLGIDHDLQVLHKTTNLHWERGQGFWRCVSEDFLFVYQKSVSFNSGGVWIHGIEVIGKDGTVAESQFRELGPAWAHVLSQLCG